MRVRATRLFSISTPNGFSGPVPALDLDFLAMTVAGALDPRITYTRTGTGSYFDSAGAMQTAGANLPRFTYNPITLLPAGLLAEPAATNLLLNSTTLATQSVTVTAVAHTISFYGTGTVVLSGTASATVVGTGAFPTRTTLTFTPTAGTLTLTVTGTVQYGQLETGTRPTTWIPTTASTALRGGDQANMTGTNFSSWYNQTEGTFVGEIVLVNPGAVTSPQHFFATTAGGASQRTVNFAFSSVQWQTYNGTANINLPGAPGNYPINKVAAGYKSGDYTATQNGLATVTRTDALVNTPNQLNIGNLSGSNQPNGTIRRLRYWNTKLTAAQEQSLTAP